MAINQAASNSINRPARQHWGKRCRNRRRRTSRGHRVGSGRAGWISSPTGGGDAGLAFLIPLVGVVAACVALGVSRASYYRARRPKPVPKPPPRPVRALSDQERALVLATLDSEPFMDKAPAQVYAKLLEDGEYLCSERTMYRVLAEHDQVRERRAQRHHPEYVKPQLVATAPNQVWSWDTTKLSGPTKGTYFTLYVILDIFSRYIVGWQVTRSESATVAQELIDACCKQQRVARASSRSTPTAARRWSRVDGAALRRPRHREEPQPAAHVERQPVLGVELPDAEVPARHARPARLYRTRAPGHPRARRSEPFGKQRQLDTIGMAF
jgi:hypothetical protein